MERGAGAFVLKMPHRNNAKGQGRGAGGRDGPQTKLELGSRRTESGGENILKRKGVKEGGKSMLFILKKKKEKKNKHQ